MFVEASAMPGSGGVLLTGSLGDVIKESAHIALGWVKSNAVRLGLAPAHTHAHTQEPAPSSSSSSPSSSSSSSSLRILENTDLHIHFPEGATPKDGPSGGVALATTLVSLLTGRTTRADTCMTGEITLSGHVLPVGGIKYKLLAAHRKKIARIILPALNASRDLHDVPKAILDAMTILPVATIDEALAHVFPDGFVFVEDDDERRGDTRRHRARQPTPEHPSKL
jgi:ATP-dependent Lon protease